MAPPILFLEDIYLNFGGTALLEGASLAIRPGERTCLVGRNGSGKSTMLKIAAGLVEPDKGERFVQPGITVRYLPQEPDLKGYKTVRDYAADGLAPGNDPHQLTILLEALGLTGDENPGRLSGGETRRAALARVLAPEPDILLLDEPTNHLDMPAIEWLEAHLHASRSAIAVISHDRRFLETLCRKTLWMDRGQSRLLNSGFADFENWRDGLLDQEETDRHKLDRKIVREQHWVTHGVSGRRKRNVRRLQELHALRDTRARERKREGNVNLTLAEAEDSGKLVVRLFGISKSFGERKIVDNLSLIVKRGDRLGIVGANGTGKTTLVNLITGKLKPDSGKVKLGHNLDILVVDQNREALDPERSLKDTLTDGSGESVVIGEEVKHVFTYMKDFLFTPDQAGTPVRALSGGECARLMLACGLRTPSNFLVLDEPTNDLDLETLDLLQEFIADYPGTVIIVSHDRDFLDRVCTSVLAGDGDGQWREYAGGYTDMLAQRKINSSEPRKASSSGKPKRKPANANSGTDPQTPGKLSFKEKHQLEVLPQEIERLEFEIAKLNEALAQPDLYAKDRKKFDAYTKALAEREESLTHKEQAWLELEMRREALEG